MNTGSNPFEELERFLDRMSRQFEEASRKWESDGPLAWAPSGDAMAVDLAEYEDKFVLTVDLPGFEREDVELRVSDHTLRLDAERGESVEESDEEGEMQYIRHERRHETASRSITLPEDVDTEAVTARMKNGVLTVTLPKTEVEESREIDVE